MSKLFILLMLKNFLENSYVMIVDVKNNWTEGDDNEHFPWITHVLEENIQHRFLFGLIFFVHILTMDHYNELIPCLRLCRNFTTLIAVYSSQDMYKKRIKNFYYHQPLARDYFFSSWFVTCITVIFLPEHGKSYLAISTDSKTRELFLRFTMC